MNSYRQIAREWVKDGLEQKNFLSSPSPQLDSLWEEMIDHKSKPKQYVPTIERPPSETIILVTGGLDSTTLYHYAKKHNYPNLRPIYIDIGHPYAEKEITALHALGIQHEYFRDPVAGNDDLYWEKFFIPARNFYLLAYAAEMMSNGGTILFGAVEEMMQYGGDKSVSFFEKVNALFDTLPAPVKVEIPLSIFTKQDSIEWLYRNNLPAKILEDSVSCYDPTPGNCGTCKCCQKKAMAMAYWGMRMPARTTVTDEHLVRYRDRFSKLLVSRDFSMNPERQCIMDLDAIKIIRNEDFDAIRKLRPLWPQS